MPGKSEGYVELSVGELARRSGVAVSALHFYEAKGLIQSRRTRGNQRRYPRGVLRRVSIIKAAQSMGIPLAEIKRAFASIPDGRLPSTEDWSRMSAAWRADLDARIARLTRLRDRLDDCIGCGCLSVSVCPLRNPQDQLSAEGKGAILLERD